MATVSAAPRLVERLAEGVGFEPTVGCPTLDFESSALNRTQPPFLKCGANYRVSEADCNPASTAATQDKCVAEFPTGELKGSRLSAFDRGRHRHLSRGWLGDKKIHK